VSQFSASQTRSKAKASADVVRSPAAPPSPRKKKSSATDLEVRQEKVERAKKLIRDPGYPPDKVVKSVARLLARELKRPEKAR
jgi:anti-sigma28 factor (negative regulator of flagellin synthesis)